MTASLDRVRENAVVNGTAAVTLQGNGADGGFRPFKQAMVDGQVATICIVDKTNYAWEVCQGTWNAAGAGGVITRGAISSSSSAGARISFAGNVCDVFITVSAVSTAIGDYSSLYAFGAVPDGRKAILLVSVAVGGTTLTVSLPAAWSASSAFAVGDVRTNNGFAFVCIGAGTSGSVGPLYPQLNGAPITDGGATWNCLGAAATTASVFSQGDIGKSLNAVRQDVVNGWCPWWHSTVGYLSVPKIVDYISPTQVRIDRVGDAAPTGMPTFPAQSWPYSATPSMVAWGTDNGPMLQAALAGGGEVFVPPGTYCYATTPTIQSNTVLSGVRGASVLMPLGAVSRRITGEVGHALVNAAFVAHFAQYEESGHTMPDFAAAMAAYGDRDIEVTRLSFDLSLSGLAMGASAPFFFLCKGVTVTECDVLGSVAATTSGPNVCACDGVTIADNAYLNLQYNFEPWGGSRNVTYDRNTITVPRLNFQAAQYGGPGDPANGVWFNVVGTIIASDDQKSLNISVEGNTIYLNGAVALAPAAAGIGFFPDGDGSVYEGVRVAGNKVFCSGTGNWPIVLTGAATNGLVQDNLIDGYDGSSNAAIRVDTEAGSAVGVYPSSVTTVASSTSITLAWPAHGYSGLFLSNGPVWVYIVGGPTAGGVTLNGYYRISSVPNANSIVVKAQSGATPTGSATVAWNGAFAAVTCAPVGMTVADNRLVNCQAPSGMGLIAVTGVGIVVRGNDAALPKGATPTYSALVACYNFNGEDPGSVTLNTGPTGVGSLPAGLAGNNRVMWNTYEPAPLVIDVDPAAALVTLSNAAYAGDASSMSVTATGGRALARLLRDFANDVRSLRNYGVTPATTDCSAALLAALSDLPAGGGAIYIDGFFNFTAPVSFSPPAGRFGVCLVGPGSGAAGLQWTSGDGLTINLTDRLHTVRCWGLSFITAATAAGTGLTITQTQPLGSFLMSTVFDCAFIGTVVGSKGWALGLFFDNVSGTTVESCSFYGSGGGSTSGTGVKYQGRGTTGADYSIYHNVAKCTFNQLAYGIVSGTYTQGITVSQSNFQNGYCDFYVPPGAVGLDQINIDMCQFAPLVGSGIDAIYLNGPTVNVTVSDCTIMPATGRAGINFGSCTYGSAEGNGIVGSGTPSSFGVVCNGQFVNVNGNQISGCVQGVLFQASSSNCVSQHNIFNVCTANVSDSGTANAVYRDNAASIANQSIGASPWTYTAGSSPEIHYVNSGTVSNIKKGSIFLSSGTNMAVNLKPHEAYTVTYTVAPNVAKELL